MNQDILYSGHGVTITTTSVAIRDDVVPLDNVRNVGWMHEEGGTGRLKTWGVNGVGLLIAIVIVASTSRPWWAYFIGLIIGVATFFNLYGDYRGWGDRLVIFCVDGTTVKGFGKMTNTNPNEREEIMRVLAKAMENNASMAAVTSER